LAVLPSVFVFTGHLALGAHHSLMAVGMVLWFGAVVGQGARQFNRTRQSSD
jgi:hypothetical protein